MSKIKCTEIDKQCREKERLVDSKTDLLVNEYSEDTENSEGDASDPAFPKHQETSIILAIQAAVSQEDHLHSYLLHVLSICRNSSTAVVCRTLITVVAIVIFVIGVIRFRDCPFEQELPLFLVLEGVAVILKTSIGAINTCHRRTKEENERNTLDTFSDIISIFLVLWTLTGTVWTFGIYSLVGTKDESRNCSKLVYACSLWFLISIYSCVAIFLIILAILSLYYKYNKTDSNKSQLPYDIRVER